MYVPNVGEYVVVPVQFDDDGNIVEVFDVLVSLKKLPSHEVAMEMAKKLTSAANKAAGKAKAAQQMAAYGGNVGVAYTAMSAATAASGVAAAATQIAVDMVSTKAETLFEDSSELAKMFNPRRVRTWVMPTVRVLGILSSPSTHRDAFSGVHADHYQFGSALTVQEATNSIRPELSVGGKLGPNLPGAIAAASVPYTSPMSPKRRSSIRWAVQSFDSPDFPSAPASAAPATRSPAVAASAYRTALAGSPATLYHTPYNLRPRGRPPPRPDFSTPAVAAAGTPGGAAAGTPARAKTPSRARAKTPLSRGWGGP